MTALQRVYAVLAVLALGGMGLALPRQGTVAPPASSAAPRPELPVIALGQGDAQAVSRIDLTRPDDDEPSQIHTITLEKVGSEWEVTSPLRTRASVSKVDALIGNLENLTPTEVVDAGSGSYDSYDLTEAKALHVVAWKASHRVSDLYFGKSDRRGQIARVAGRDGVLAIANQGPKAYSGFLFTRDLRGWREPSIFQFKPEDVRGVTITNKNGWFSFSRGAGHWVGTFTRRGRDGGLGTPEESWPGFDESKVEDLLRMYKSLSADDFGEEKDRADAGLDQAEETGGVIDIQFDGDRRDAVLRVGRLTGSTTRWAIKDSRWALKVGGDGTLYALSPYTAGWALADATRFERATRP